MSTIPGDAAQPYPYPPLAPPGPNRTTAGGRIGDELGRAFNLYLASFQDWIVPGAIAFAIFIGSLMLCGLPSLVVGGPLACGMFAVALSAFRGAKVEAATMQRGMDLFKPSALAMLVILALQQLPMLLVMALACGGFSFTVAAMNAGEEELGIGGYLLTFVCMFIGMLPVMAWQLFIGTRFMFALPLIADRGLDFQTALKTSWNETREHFWELLLVHFLASVIGGLGASVLYVGLIFTLPLYYLITAAAYEARLANVEGAR